MAAIIEQVLDRAAILHRAGRLAEAERLYRQILAINPSHADSLHLLGVIAHQAGHSDQAVDLIGKAIALNDRSADFHSNIGTALDVLGRFDDAESHYERAIVLNPNHLDARNNLGNTLFKRGKFAQATVQFGRAVMATPHDALAHFNLGNALLAQGDIQAAIARYERALFLKSGWPEPHYNLGRALSMQGRLDEAALQFRHALDCKPDYAEANSELAAVLQQLGQLAEAQACARRALEIRLDDVGSLNVLGTSLLAMGRAEEAIDCFRRAVAARPEYPALHSNLIFALNFDPTANAADRQNERAAWAERHASLFTGAIRAHDNDRDPDRRLRIGYVSSHFRRQAATCAFGGVIVNHDADRFEVICYSDTMHEDTVTQRLVECADTWHRTAGLDDDALANLIQTDCIDILVDLVGHMRGHRLLVFARKPAPIQVTAWGEPSGTGLKTMDYLFADPVLVTPENRKLLTEEVIDLPNFLGLWLPQTAPEPKPLPARSRGHITFGSFNRLGKVQEQVLASWAAILRSVAGSRLVLKDRTLIDSSQQQRILTSFAAHGVETGRITLLDLPDATEPYEAYHDIDLALDPFQHSGGITTLEALWMGVPVVTCVGRTIPSRLTAASLSALGLTDFIAPDVEAYVKLAVAKARDTDGLARLRSTLRKRVVERILITSQLTTGDLCHAAPTMRNRHKPLVSYR
jgi:predicted O-linked N-acetylglucosamine transferase (SPINDLY family)